MDPRRAGEEPIAPHPGPSPKVKVKPYPWWVLRIATFARMAGLSAKMLRDYDEIGLFRPAWVDPLTGYRAYSPAQLPRLRRILALRALGIGLDEIGRLASGGADLAEVLERRRADLERERREVDRRLAALDIEVTMATGSDQPDVVVRPVETESIARLAGPGGADLEGDFYALETIVRDLGIRARRPPGALVEEDHATAFVPVRRSAMVDRRIVLGQLPAVRAATVIHQGSYATLRAARRAVERWAAVAGYRTAGPLRVIYLQFGGEPELALPADYLVERAADFVTELQLPVT